MHVYLCKKLTGLFPKYCLVLLLYYNDVNSLSCQSFWFCWCVARLWYWVLFMCLLAILLIFFCEGLFKPLKKFKLGIFVRILSTNPLSHVCFVCLYSHSVICLCILPTVSLMWLFLVVVFCNLSEKPLSTPLSWWHSPAFSSESSVVSAFICACVLHLKSVFVSDVR